MNKYASEFALMAQKEDGDIGVLLDKLIYMITQGNEEGADVYYIPATFLLTDIVADVYELLEEK